MTDPAIRTDLCVVTVNGWPARHTTGSVMSIVCAAAMPPGKRAIAHTQRTNAASVTEVRRPEIVRLELFARIMMTPVFERLMTSVDRPRSGDSPSASE
jgi:hypothetical protein